jgi:hypothetical protein
VHVGSFAALCIISLHNGAMVKTQASALAGACFADSHNHRALNREWVHDACPLTWHCTRWSPMGNLTEAAGSRSVTNSTWWYSIQEDHGKVPPSTTEWNSHLVSAFVQLFSASVTEPLVEAAAHGSGSVSTACPAFSTQCLRSAPE